MKRAIHSILLGLAAGVAAILITVLGIAAVAAAVLFLIALAAAAPLLAVVIAAVCFFVPAVWDKKPKKESDAP